MTSDPLRPTGCQRCSTQQSGARRPRLRRAATAVLWLLLALGCGAPSLPRPLTTEQPEGAFEEVSYPPPPARPEVVPPAPAEERAVWVDGFWRWRRGRWSWVLGRWQLPPTEEARWAEWAWKRLPDGTLLYARSRWLGPDGAEVQPPPPLRLAEAMQGDVREDTGRLVDVGRNRERLGRGRPGAARGRAGSHRGGRRHDRDCQLDCLADAGALPSLDGGLAPWAGPPEREEDGEAPSAGPDAAPPGRGDGGGPDGDVGAPDRP